MPDSLPAFLRHQKHGRMREPVGASCEHAGKMEEASLGVLASSITRSFK